MHATFTVGEGERIGFATALGRGRRAIARSPSAPRRGRRPHRRHRRGLALLGGRARRLRRPAQGARPAQHARAEGADLPADRRDRRRADDARCRRASAASATGTTATPGSATPASRIEALYIGACSDEAEEFVSFMTSSAGGRASGGLAADHVRDRRRARPLRARAGPPARLARLAPGARGQRRLEPDPARRLRRAAQRAARLPRAPGRAASRDPGLRGRPGGHRGAALARDGLGHLGDARRAAPPPVLQGPVLDGARSRREDRAQARPARQRRGMGGRARRDPRRHPRTRLERDASRPTRSPSTATTSTPPRC